ncbi:MULTISPECIES: sugar ABC transporter ATP-binding protein [Cupriavidus]|uniref:Monosaccharide ABC transporter ATP-binding protein, CUT2 family n=1 Tax=Cupriavidus pinatubonensis (strain JMP 134 / LMG 1197) TaxID=264198 RepID=Q46TP7_CUPPJ|nr:MULTISPECIES: sugar ABC transporter ATP-binding protein [Cupriavidus]QYY28774.1 sugar ABC transporter ATP-binding protein [Cupriavidus pinatubonensis]
MNAMTQVSPLLEMRGICKTFPGVKALDDVSFDIYPGEVHMLLGENGAGKSSLMKVLCGVYVADAGEFHHQGQRVEVSGPADTMRLGIAVIFQEFSLVPYLDIAQNIFLGREPRGRVPGSVDHAKMHAEARRLLDTLGMDISTHTPVHRLGVAQQQMIEIAKALSQNARILVLDEPTAALSERETEKLFGVIARLKADGVSMIYISHRMAEVFALGDRITVMRDGRKVGSYMPGDATPDELVARMVGRKVDMGYTRTRGGPVGEVALDMQGVSADNGIDDITLQVRAGEIVGLAGLVGSGRSEVARAVFGADPVRAGEIRIFGKSMRGGPDKARALGAALIPESRKTEGLALIRSVRDNLLLAGLRRAFPAHWYRSGKAAQLSTREIGRLRIATPSGDQLAQFLSGGNQQKIVIGKWLVAESRLFIFDEPTRGIDVGAKAEIFALIDGLVKQGAAVLLISSELPEIINVCDRTYVMRGGRVAGELAHDAMTEESILQLGMNDA